MLNERVAATATGPHYYYCFLVVVALFYKKEVKLRNGSHLSIALQLRCGTAREVTPPPPPHQCDFQSLVGLLLSATHLAPGTQRVPELTGYLLHLFTEFDFAPRVIEPGWGSWTQFQGVWLRVFPHQQTVLCCQQGVRELTSVLTLSTRRQNQIAQVKGSVP